VGSESGRKRRGRRGVGALILGGEGAMRGPNKQAHAYMSTLHQENELRGKENEDRGQESSPIGDRGQELNSIGRQSPRVKP
jgi:hypothetical protein